MLANIYGLVDPRRPDWVMYVGKGLEKRARSHWKRFLRNGWATNALLRRWLESLAQDGVEPSWHFIEENVLDWQEREKYWIAFWREINSQLCNVSNGGNWVPMKDPKHYHEYHVRAGRIGGSNAKRDADGKSISARKGGLIGGPIGGQKVHEKKNADGKSVAGAWFGYIVHVIKNCDGKSAHAHRIGQLAHMKKDFEGKSIHARNNGKLWGASGAGNHFRWHILRNLINPNCKLCQETKIA